MKNFTKLHVNGWYLNRGGSVVHITCHEEGNGYGYHDSMDHCYTEDGSYDLISISDRDLITEIEPPVIVPKKPMKQLYSTILVFLPVGKTKPTVTAYVRDTQEALDQAVNDLPKDVLLDRKDSILSWEE